MAKEPTYTLPGGHTVPVKQLVDHSYYAGRHTTIYSKPSEYLKEVNPDCEYAWVQYTDTKGRADNPRLYGMLRAGIYRAVEESELREDTDLEYHVTKADFVAFRDVALVEIPRDHAERLYRYKQHRSLQSLIGVDAIRSDIEANTNGAVTAEVEMKVVRE